MTCVSARQRGSELLYCMHVAGILSDSRASCALLNAGRWPVAVCQRET